MWLLAGIFDPLLKRLDKHRNRRFREAELEREIERDQTTEAEDVSRTDS
jgi:hypothetical protein